MSGRNGGGALRPRKRWLADQLDWLSNEPQWRRGLTTPQTRMGGLRLKKFLPCRNGGGALRPRKHVTCRLGWPHDGLAAMEAGPYDPANRSLSLPPLTRAVAADGERWAATVEMMHPRTGFVRLSRCIVAGTELASGPRGKSRHLSAR